MIDVWGHGSNGSLINAWYNTYYGMGYNNTILTKSRFEINSFFYSSSTIAIWVLIWIRQNMMIEILMLYQSILNLGISHVGKSHKSQNSAIAILLNKCDDNYS
jgi:hypothetical protein